jgi:hypothetical protein
MAMAAVEMAETALAMEPVMVETAPEMGQEMVQETGLVFV